MIPQRTNKTISLLLFNSSTVYSSSIDECSIYWSSSGNPSISYDNDLNKQVLNLSQTSKSYLKSDKTIILGDSDFTIDGCFYIDKTTNSYTYSFSSSSYLFDLMGYWTGSGNIDYKAHNFQAFRQTRDRGVDDIYIRFGDNNDSIFVISNNHVPNTWFHIAIVCIYYTFNKRLFKVFFNGKLQLTQYYYGQFSKFHPTCIGRIADNNLSNLANTTYTGKCGYFRIEKQALFTNNFDPNKYMINNFYDIKEKTDIIRTVYNNDSILNYKAFIF